MNKTVLIVSSLFALIIGFLVGKNINFNSEINTKNIITESKIVKDTVVKILKSEPLVLTKVKTKVTTIRDTVILAQPFIAKIDTVVMRDTVRASFEFPSNLMSIGVTRHPDSIKIEKITVYKDIIKERPWWESPAYILGGTVAGFLLGRATK